MIVVFLLFVLRKQMLPLIWWVMSLGECYIGRRQFDYKAKIIISYFPKIELFYIFSFLF